MKELEYHMLDGKSVNETSSDSRYKKGAFLAKMNNGDGLENEPEGMFRVSNISEGKIILTQINCDSAHWKGDSIGRIRGPNKNCQSRCEYFRRCPIRDYILLLKSGFE
ncbi:MAG: hypothetical protein Q8N63_00990 [Nanoarchaeota archaeon]|nr:hypothetical protein [Nanoarchaeota archaeon]